MKNTILTFCLLVVCMLCAAQTKTYQSWNKVASQRAGVLNINYFENFPYAFADPNGNHMGIEIDIIKEFQHWLATYKGVEITLNYQKYDNFNTFYTGIKDGGNGTV